MLWRGAGHDDPSPEESAMSTSPGRSPVVACDVDGDGLRDAVLADATTLEVVRVGIAEVWTAAIEEGESIRGCGDVDGDGRARVLLQQGQHGSLRIVTWSSAGHGSEQHLTSPRPRELVAVGDYDGDGQAELVLRRFDRVYIASVDEVESADPSADLPPLEERVARRQQALSTAW
jgi:hypothetical protein